MLVGTLPINGLTKHSETGITAVMQELTIHFPGKVVFGKGALNGLVGELRQMAAEKIVIITIPPLLTKLQHTLEHLARHGMEVSVNTSIKDEPSFEDFRNIMDGIAPFDPDVVVGIGGGSVLDITKLVAAQLDNEQCLEDYVGIGLLKSRKKKLICMPATSGTGSEVSPNAILVDNRDQQKKGIISPFLVPDLVLVDPLLTVTVPPEITAATGLDALIHCLEAYTNKFAHPLIDVYAYEGMQQIARNLVRAVKDGTDEEARTGVSLGSLLGGFCLGPVNTAGVHALSYPLGSTFHLAHGLSNALLLPYVMEFNLSAAPHRYAAVALALGCEKAETDEETAYRGIEKIKTLMQECGVPSRLREVGIPEDAIPEMAAAALKITRLLKNNPRTITEEDAVAIYKAAY
jgi:alcohol dehydrogenase